MDISSMKQQIVELVAQGAVEQVIRLVSQAQRGGVKISFQTGQFHDAVTAGGELRTVTSYALKPGKKVDNQYPPFVMVVGDYCPDGPEKQGPPTWFAMDFLAIFQQCLTDVFFVHAILAQFSAEGPRAEYDAETLEGIIGVARFFDDSLPSYMKVSRSAERVALCSALYHDRLPLAVQVGISESAFRSPCYDRRRVLNRLIDRLVDIGMDLIDIRDHFLACLEHDNHKRSMESVFRLAGAKCFERSGRTASDAKLIGLLRERYIQRFWSELLQDTDGNSKQLPLFGFIAQFAEVYRLSEAERAFLDEGLAEILSHGRYLQAWEIIDLIGDAGSLGLYNTGGHPDVGGGSGMSEKDCHRDYAQRYLYGLVPAAYECAVGREDLAVVAALILRFEAVRCLPVKDQRSSFDLGELARAGNVDEQRRFHESVGRVNSVLVKAVGEGKRITIEGRPYYLRD